jgi:hypothetical protein
MIRNNPVRAITYFLPTEEVKTWFHFIFYKVGGVRKSYKNNPR